MKKTFERINFCYRQCYRVFSAFGVLNLILCCVFLSCGCKGKSSTNTNMSLTQENIINLDLSIPGTFSAIYLYRPSILCNKSVVVGSAVLRCEFYTESLVIPPPKVLAYSSAYIEDLAASIANACSIPSISPDANFTSTPSITASCLPGTAISCIATGVGPERSVSISEVCP